MPHYEVWCEGYAATGEFLRAYKVGEADAETFQQACQQLLGYDKTYEPQTNRLWGMRLYDNEREAREFLG